MIELNVQLLTFFVSFLYGFWLYIVLEVSYKFLTSSSLMVAVISSFLFVVCNTFLYFIILLYVNNGYVHIYFLICIFLGYLLCKVIYKWFVNEFRM